MGLEKNIHVVMKKMNLIMIDPWNKMPETERHSLINSVEYMVGGFCSYENCQGSYVEIWQDIFWKGR